MMGKAKKKDVIVLGGGAGGLALAKRAAGLGLSVGIIDPYSKLGGDCLHLGCVPSKTLLAVAQQRQQGADWTQIKSHLDEVRETIQPRYSQKHMEQLGCEVCIGQPKFVDPYQLLIQQVDHQEKLLWTAKKIIIATGSRPSVLTIPGLNSSDIHTNETIYQLSTLPQSMVIIGAGVTGIEFAQAFQRLGVSVTVLVHSEGILRTLDRQGGDLLAQTLKKEGVTIYTDANVIQASKINYQDLSKVKIEIEVETKEGGVILETEVVFLATGRLPNIENLNLEKIGVSCKKQGIMVDDYFRTNVKHIYAIGDVVAWPHRFTHMAEYGAEVVYKHLIFKNFAPKRNLTWVPGVIFTSPEMASLGLTEQEAKAKKLAYDILYWEFKELDRAAIENKPEGFIKLLLVKQKIIGATVVCERAGELLAELGLLMQKDLSIFAIAETIHAYPTWAEGLCRAVQAYREKQALSDFAVNFFIKKVFKKIMIKYF